MWPLLLLLLVPAVLSKSDGLAMRPPMGWSGWKKYHFEANETMVMTDALAISRNGMLEAGYRFISLDGGWWGGGKSGKVRRNASGFFSVNETKFPSGIPALSRYITDLGFNFGTYTATFSKMCSGDVGGSMNHEAQDVALFASWNFSMIKLDDCGTTNVSATMRRWSDLIDATGRRVVIFNSQNGCCLRGQAGCNSAYTVMPQWCYDTSHMWFTPLDGNDVWENGKCTVKCIVKCSVWTL